MKIVSVVGARPNFVKAAMLSRVLRPEHEEIILHTGQHYDYEMSKVFFEELEIPEPQYNLGVGSGSHGRQTGEMLIRIEEVLEQEKPHWVIAYGDVNSTLAGALAAVKIGIPVAHVEAGLRSYDRAMPEEINRVLSDHLSSLLFCPTDTAVGNLAAEGITRGVHNTGDVMYDAFLHYLPIAEAKSTVLQKLGLKPSQYLLATIHRASTTDDRGRLGSILRAFERMDETVVLPIHPRTKQAIDDLEISGNLRVIPPVGYLDMLKLERNARMILTDSGGVQKEAYFAQVPCLTLRDSAQPEWRETVEAGANIWVGTDTEKIIAGVRGDFSGMRPCTEFGDGNASTRIAELLRGQGHQ
ncbi:MAG: UDP-N-acetylglucosamine 2-epimerase (non-hydrolyzing) [Chloroflexi bacterium]|nr:UDP-N-acetylglucosamine 2-epimerase (non-hydrolyzing) [Chloroflexota bacterium]